MPVYKGILSHVSGGSLSGNWTKREFITVGGERIRNVSIDNYLGSFMEIGQEITVSTAKFINGQTVVSIKRANGEVVRADFGPLIVGSVVSLLQGTVVWAIVAWILSVYGSGLLFHTDNYLPLFFVIYPVLLLIHPVVPQYKLYRARNAIT